MVQKKINLLKLHFINDDFVKQLSQSSINFIIIEDVSLSFPGFINMCFVVTNFEGI